MRTLTTSDVAEVAAYVAAHGWTLEREETDDFAGFRQWVLWASKPDMVLAGSWFGSRTQGYVELMLLPEMQAADADAPARAACAHVWVEGPGDGLEECAHDCHARRFSRERTV